MERRIYDIEKNSDNYVTNSDLKDLKIKALWILLCLSLGLGLVGNKAIGGIIAALLKSGSS